MRRSAFVRVFRVLAIVGVALFIVNAIWPWLEAAKMIGHDANWLFWLSADVFACTVLSLTLLVMAVMGYRKDVVLFPFRLKKPIHELTPSERLEYHSRTLSFVACAGIGGVFLGPGQGNAVDAGLVSSSSTLVWLLRGCGVICFAVILGAAITSLVFTRRAKRLKRQEEASSDKGDEATPSADPKGEK